MKLQDLKYKTKSEVDAIMLDHFFTDDEVSIIKLSLKGKSIQQIADELCLSPRTIIRRKNNINDKIST